MTAFYGSSENPAQLRVGGSYSSSLRTSSRPVAIGLRPSGESAATHRAPMWASLTVTVGAHPVAADYYFPEDVISVPRYVPTEWIEELSSMRSEEHPGELDDFYKE